MDTTMLNFADNLVASDVTKPLMDIIEQIMSIPEESLTDDSTEVISGMIMGAFTKKMREDSIRDMIENFEDLNLSRKQAYDLVNQSRQELQSGIDNLQPSAHKRAIFDAVFDFFFEVFDKALERYHTYAFELPVKLDKGAQLPTYAHDTDACADLYAVEDMTIPAHSLSNMIHTGIRIALPESWVFLIDPRSSIGLKSGLRLSNSVGIVDEDYRGEICVLYDNISDSDYEIKAGDRIAQCWIQQVRRFKPIKVDELPATERGEGGFGSTGK